MLKFRWETELKETEIGKIPKDWNVVPLNQVLAFLKDGSHNPPKRVETGIRFIAGATSIKYFEIDFSECTYITKEDYDAIHKYYQIMPNDVLLTIVGTVGNVAIVKESDLPFSLQRSIAILRCNERINADFLFYWLCSPVFKKMLDSHIAPTAQPGIYLGELANLLLPLPELKEQLTIGKILRLIDEEISIKRRTNTILERIGQAAFKAWFVGYEPFLKESFMDTELGKVPKGWQVKRIKDIGEIGGGSTPSTRVEDYWDGNIPWITPKDLAASHDENFVYISKGERDITKRAIDECSLRLFPAGTILFTSRAPIGYVAIAENDVATNQGFKNIIPRSDIYRGLIYLFLKTNVEYLRDIAGGSTFSELTASTLGEVELAIPPIAILQQFHDLLEPIFLKRQMTQKQIIALTRIRDLLLPLIVSGKLRVEEI